MSRFAERSHISKKKTYNSSYSELGPPVYVHLVRRHLDYASQVWSPHQEAVEHRETKLMVGNRVSYKERLNKTSLM